MTAKAAQISRKRRVGAYLRTTITLDPDTEKPDFVWHFDQDAIDAEARYRRLVRPTDQP